MADPYQDEIDSARSKFTKGERVRLSRDGLSALRSHRHDHATRGTVVGYGRGPELVRVLRDGHKTPDTYHCSFWESAESDAVGSSSSQPGEPAK